MKLEGFHVKATVNVFKCANHYNYREWAKPISFVKFSGTAICHKISKQGNFCRGIHFEAQNNKKKLN